MSEWQPYEEPGSGGGTANVAPELIELNQLDVGGAAAGQVPTFDGAQVGWATPSGGGGGYTLPTASASVLGGVKVGSGLSITSGVLAATGGGGATVPYRAVAGTTDTPSIADKLGLIDYSNAGAVAITVNDLGAGVSYSVHQVGAGQLTLSPGSSVTLRYQGLTVSNLASVYIGSIISVICNGNGTVDLKGNA